MSAFMIYLIVGLVIIFISGCLFGIIEELELEVSDLIDAIINDGLAKYYVTVFIALTWPISLPIGLAFGLSFLAIFLTKKFIKKFIKKR